MAVEDARRASDLGNRILERFGHVYVINLPYRTDRRREVEAQLRIVGLSFAHPGVTLFAACRPEDPGDWPGVGVRGCFMSHLGVLTDAVEAGRDRILILEDDFDWSAAFLRHGHETLDALAELDWRFLHGGHVREGDRAPEAVAVAPETSLTLTHFIALAGGAVAEAQSWLSEVSRRAAGDPRGGPMHVDGAYSWLRRADPNMAAYTFAPAIGAQRASRTDIHAQRWYDSNPVTARLASFYRAARNRWRG